MNLKQAWIWYRRKSTKTTFESRIAIGGHYNVSFIALYYIFNVVTGNSVGNVCKQSFIHSNIIGHFTAQILLKIKVLLLPGVISHG